MYEIPIEKGSKIKFEDHYGYVVELDVAVVDVREIGDRVHRSIHFTEENELEHGISEIDEEGVWAWDPCASGGGEMTSNRLRLLGEAQPGDEKVVLLADVRWVKDLNNGETWGKT